MFFCYLRPFKGDNLINMFFLNNNMELSKMKNKNNELWIFVFIIFLIFGGVISLTHLNSDMKSSNYVEDQNKMINSVQTDGNIREKFVIPKSQTIFVNGSYISDYEVPEYSYTLAIVDDVLFLGTLNDELYVLNISNPINPTLISHYTTNHVQCGDFLVENDVLYISENPNGLRMLNISDIHSISEISFFDNTVTEGVYDTAIYEGYMYLASYNYLLKIVDLADLTATTPSFNVLYESLSQRSQKLNIYNDTLYFAMDYYVDSDWSPRLRYYSLSDPLNPAYIGQKNLKVWDFEFDNDIMYLSSTDGIHIYNVSNPNNLIEISNVTFTESIEFELALDNDLLIAGSKYTDNSDTYLMAFNVSDPYAPYLLWNISTYESGDDGEIEEMIIKDGLIYASQYMHGLVVYDTGLDTDEDGLSDKHEQYTYNTNPTIQDTDNDGLLDGEEVYTYGTDPINNDTDADLLLDGDEIYTYTTDPTTNDTDSDTLNDWDELFLFHLDPTDDDFDNDGLDDGTEMADYISANNLNGTEEEIFAEQQTYAHDPDRDNDGLTDGQEVNNYHSDPNNNDSDNDGLFDGDEVMIYNSDPINTDSDGDGVDDGIEIGIGLNPAIADSDSDGFSDLKDFISNFGEDASAAYSNDGFIQISYGTESEFAEIKTNSTLYSAFLNEENEVIVCKAKGDVGTDSLVIITLTDTVAQYTENLTIKIDDVDTEYVQSIDEITNSTILQFQFAHTGEIQIISIFFDTDLDLSLFDLTSISGYPLTIILISFVGVVFVLRKKHSC